MSEIWKTVVGYPLHECSNRGRIRRTTTKRVIKGSANRDGYLMTSLAKHQSRAIHRLVYKTFIGEPPPGMHVAHMDGNPANNAVENLVVCTPRVNCSHKLEHGTQTFGSGHHSAKLTEADVVAIREMRARGATLREISKTYGLRSDSSVLNITNRKSWKHVV